MFDGARFITPGVSERVSVEMQQFLWHLIDKLKAEPNTELDYLQVFELTPGKGGGQLIKHFQEVPLYCAEYGFENVEMPLVVKIYIIDDGAHSTMLLPEER